MLVPPNKYANPIQRYRSYIILTLLIIAITAGNYILSGGAKSNWTKTTQYGFTILTPPTANLWITGLDDDNVFDLYGNTRATTTKSMLGFNDQNKEFAVTWTTLSQSQTPERTLQIHYHSGEVNSILRDREFTLETQPATTGTVNRHTAAYQIHTITLTMPDTDQPLYAKGIAVGWTCTETGKTYVAYVLHWSTGQPPNISDAELTKSLYEYLDTLKCH